MKQEHTTKLFALLLLAFAGTMFSSQKANAQACPGSQVTIIMDSLVQKTPTTVEFVVFIVNTGTTALKMSSFPGGFTYNSSFLPSGTTLAPTTILNPANCEFPTLNPISALTHQQPTSQIRWTNNAPANFANSVPMLPNDTMLLCKMRLTLGSGVWPANTPCTLTWNWGLSVTQFSRVSAVVYCETNTNSSVLSETTAGTMVVVNAATIILNPTLPVAYSKFTGRKSKQTNLLEWTTGNEQNNSHFNIQKSIDGKNFTTIGRVDTKAPNGQSAHDLDYSFVDVNPKLGYNYFQLEQVDIDGHTSLSEMVSILWSNETKAVSIFPNPTTDQLNVEFSTEKSSQIEVRLSDLTGRLLKTIKANAVVGTNTLTIDMNELPNGIYNMVVYENGQTIHTEKVTKK